MALSEIVELRKDYIKHNYASIYKDFDLENLENKKYINDIYNCVRLKEELKKRLTNVE